MKFCFLAPAFAACLLAAPPAGSTASVVRADTRTGRLVRVVAQPTGDNAAPSTLREAIEVTARKHDVDPLLVHSVIAVESNYNPFAVSVKGAQGLMQLIPSTARRFGVANSFNPAENLEGGVRYLKHLLELYHGDTRLALAAYNAGEGAVAKYSGTVPPYKETQNYVYQVGKKLGQARRAAEPPPPAAPPARSDGYSMIEQVVSSDGSVFYRTR